jgi:hypothetical protein
MTFLAEQGMSWPQATTALGLLALFAFVFWLLFHD